MRPDLTLLGRRAADRGAAPSPNRGLERPSDAEQPRDGRHDREAACFGAYVRSLAAGRDPDPELLDAVLERLRRLLSAELRRRGLWQAPPCYLGIHGGSWWQDGGEPLDELVAECYGFVFLERLRSLTSRAHVPGAAEGLVRLGVRHFVHDRQRAFDPLGYRVFEALHGAVRRLVEKGELRVVRGDPRIRNATLLAYSRAPGQEWDGGLEERVAGWGRDLLPLVLDYHGRGGAQRFLEERLAALPDRGVGAFRFKELIDALKRQARADWSEILNGETAPRPSQDGRLAGPEPEAAAADGFRKLTACVEASIAAAADDEATRRYLGALWTFVHAYATEADVEEGPRGELPSRRRLAALLGIPRDRLPELFRILGRATERCRERLHGPVGGARMAGERR